MSILSALRSWLYGPSLPEVAPPDDACEIGAPLEALDDILLFAGGIWCYRHQLDGFRHLGDFHVLSVGTSIWSAFRNNPEAFTS